MPILLACACGKKMKARDELAGKKVKCPGCGAAVAVPLPEEEAEPEIAAVEAAPERRPDPAQAVREKEPARAAKGGPPPLPPPLPAPKSRRPDPDDDEEDDEPSAEAPKKRTRRSRRGSDGGFAPLSAADFPSHYLCKAGFKKRLLSLQPDGFWFADGLDGKDLKRARRDLEEGLPPAEALGDTPGLIPFQAVTRIRTNLHHPNLFVDWKAEDEKQTLDFQFEEAEDRDLALRHLRGLAPWDFRRKEHTALSAALKPMLWIVGIVAVTIALIFLANYLETAQHGTVRMKLWALIIYYILRFLGPWGIAAIGGLSAIGCVVWLCVRVGTPPIDVTLTPEEAGKVKVPDEDEED